LLGGFVFGPAGWYWRWTSGNARIAAIALLGAVYVAEGLDLTVILPEKAIGFGFAVAGMALPLLFGSSWRDRAHAWLGMIPALLLGALGYVALTALSSGLAAFWSFLGSVRAALAAPDRFTYLIRKGAHQPSQQGVKLLFLPVAEH